MNRFIKALLFAAGVLNVLGQAHAATFNTFVDNQAGFLAAIGSGTIETIEDFSAAVDMQSVGTATPDTWNGFTIQAVGTPGPTYGPSRYCAALNAGGGSYPTSCLYWNSTTPAVPGIYGVMYPDVGVSFRPASPTIAGFSFQFSDWNDVRVRSHLIVRASDGTETTVDGGANLSNTPPKTFGVTLSPADIRAGLYIEELRWVGVSGDDEVVGFYDVRTYTNPFLQAVPLGGTVWLGLLAMLTGLMGVRLLRRR
jgi:hypothetical protein